MDRAKELGDEARERIRALFAMIEAQESQREAEQQQKSAPRAQHQPISSVEHGLPVQQGQCRPLPQQTEKSPPHLPAQELSLPQAQAGPQLISARKRAEELGKEARERIKKLYEVIEEFKEVQRQIPNDLIQFEDSLPFESRLGPDGQPLPQEPLGPLLPLEKGPRLLASEQAQKYQQERFFAGYKEARTRGFPPLLPDEPDEIPDWAQGIPEQRFKEPEWPKEYYTTSGPLACPWENEEEGISPEFHQYSPTELYEEFDPYYCPVHQRGGHQVVPTHLDDLAPVWNQPLQNTRSTPTFPIMEQRYQWSSSLEHCNHSRSLPPR